MSHILSHAFDSEISKVEDLSFTLLFDDPTTISITSMDDDLSFVYATRTDGKILQGSHLLWQSRRVFSDSNEKEVINFIGDATNVVVEKGLLKLTKSKISL